ncbi:MAG TPA: ABC transporter permease [Longimicrobiales bacterium]
MSSARPNQLRELTLARVREFLREPEAVFWTFFFPVLMALALGIAFRDREPGPIPVGVERGGPAEAAFAALDSAPSLAPRWVEPEAVDRALRDGDVALVVRATPDGIVYRFDPSRDEARTARYAVDDAVQTDAGRRDVRAVSDERITARGTRYIDFLIPGLIGFNLLSTGLWGSGFTIVRMRSGKLLKRLVATPMRRGNFLLSFVLARLVWLVPELLLLLGFARLVFDYVVAGSVLSALAVTVLGAFTFSGLGLLIASRAKTIEGVSGLMNVASFPMWILSGAFFSYENFPQVMHPLIRALPLTALIDALRGIMNDGLALWQTWPQLLVLLGWTVGSFVVALAIFRWR